MLSGAKIGDVIFACKSREGDDDTKVGRMLFLILEEPVLDEFGGNRKAKFVVEALILITTNKFYDKGSISNVYGYPALYTYHKLN